MFSNKLFLSLIFFVLDFIHITLASKKTNNFILRDENNIVRDVEPAEIQEQQAPQTKEQVTKQFKELIDKEDYNGIVKLDVTNKKDFSEHLCSAITTLDHYKNLFESLTDHDLIPDFLAHGNETLVKEAIVEFPVNSSEYYIHPEDISRAIVMCLDKDSHERVFSLLENVRARFVEVDRRLKKQELDTNFRNFNRILFIDYFRRDSNVSLKRFIAFHGEELQRKYPEIFVAFFVALLYFLACYIYDSDLRQFYSDLIGQSSPSMLNLSAEGFLPGEIGKLLRQPLITCDWREAISESLKGKSLNTGHNLWNIIMAKYPGEFPTEFPPSGDTLTVVLKKFKSKQELEDDWTMKNIPVLLKKLETIAFNPPTVLWNIIFEYATVTWATTLSWDTDSTNEIIEIENDIILHQDPQQRQLIIHRQEQFKELIDQGQYDEIVKLGDEMESRELLRYLCSLMTTLDHLKGLFKYLENRKMLLTFFVHGNTRLVGEAIVEFGSPQSNFYIYTRLVVKAITFFFNKGTYDRVIDILRTVKAKHMKLCAGMEQSKWEVMFEEFIRRWFIHYAPEENSFPIKHFLTLHGEDFATKYPDTFDTFCRALVRHLRSGLPYPKTAALLIDLVAQRSLLTPTTFAKGFLSSNHDADRLNFFNYGWKEAIEEGLRQKYPNGGEQLWAVMVKNFPEKFTGAYPNTDKLRAIATGRDASVTDKIVSFVGWGLSFFGMPEPPHYTKIKSKKQIEDEWFEKNLPKLLKHFEDIAALLPKEVMEVIYGYLTFTWIIS